MSTALSLWDRFASLPDPRSPLGRRHPLPALLTLVALAVLCGARSLEAIAQFARDRGPGFRTALGFTHRRAPCKATLSNLLRRLDIDALESALAGWMADRLGPEDARLIALDGKRLRGSADGALGGVHLLAAYAPDVAAVLLQARVGGGTNEHKAALEMLGALPLRGAVLTADAMFTHADFAAGVLEGGGDYILPVGDNQPTLRADIALAFETPEGLSPPAAAAVGGRPAVGPVGR
jgi:hypothetical protein